MFAGLALAVCLSAFAQHGGEHGGGGHPGGDRVGGGFVPQHGPAQAPHQEAAPHNDAGAHNDGGHGPAGHNAAPARDFRDGAGHPNAPHVHPDGQWVGHDENRGNYHMDHPWAHGHFPGQIGPSYVYRLRGGGPSRFFFNGFYFSVAPEDLGYAGGWLWSSDDVVLYDDPDDPGYYLAYNPRTGTYVHVIYVGS
jgi:hypothetical protein